MNAVKSKYTNAPALIPVPEEFHAKNIEVIFIATEDKKTVSNISRFFGILPDFPDRASPGELQTQRI